MTPIMTMAVAITGLRRPVATITGPCRPVIIGPAPRIIALTGRVLLIPASPAPVCINGKGMA